MAQMIFGVLSGPQPHPTANFGHFKYTGLSFPSYTAIFSKLRGKKGFLVCSFQHLQFDSIQKNVKNNYAQDAFSL